MSKLYVIGLIGLAGSGKSTIAKTIAKELGTKIVESNAIRIALREEGKTYVDVRGIVSSQTGDFLSKGHSVVVDADHIDASKRTKLHALAKKYGAELHYVRVVCDMDTAIGRMAKENYEKGTHAFFGSSTVKIREFVRRLPAHYAWSPQGGGSWKLRKLSFSLATTIDTTDVAKWKETVSGFVKKIQK